MRARNSPSALSLHALQKTRTGGSDHPGASPGFTLIELLLVIVIVAVLMAALYPVYARVREKARQVVCASNLRQIGVAVGLYKADYDDFYPYAVENGIRYQLENKYEPAMTTWRQMPTFPESLRPYCKSADVYRCPDDAFPFKAYDSNYNRYTAESRFDAYGTSYIFAACPFDEKGNVFPLWDQPKDDLSSLFYAGDIGAEFHAGPSASYDDKPGNILYRDGHVRFVRPGL